MIFLRRWRDERGGAMLTMISAIGLGLFGVLVLMDIFAFFVARRVGPTAADAASLAAMKEAEIVFNQVARQAVQARIADLLDVVRKDTDKRMADCEERRDNQPPGAEPIECHYDRFWRSALHARVRDPVVENALRQGTEVPLMNGLGEFMNARERGCLVYQAGEEGAESIRQAAELFATENGAVRVTTVQFPYDNKIKVQVAVSAFIPLGFTARFAAEADKLLPAASSSRAADLGLTFDLAGPCGH